MKVLFIGGTGTISAAISRLLIAQGHELWLLNRGKRSQALPPGAHHIHGDIHDEEGVKALLTGHRFDVVADFIAFAPAHIERDVRLFAGNTRQFIFISSASAYQKPLSHYLITESTPLANPYWQYSRDKIACEELLMRIYRDTGFPITIVRPSHTYDERGVPVAIHGHLGSAPVLRRMKAGLPVLIHGDGSSLWTFTHNSDFANGFIGLLGNPHAIGEAVHITSDESLTWNQAAHIVAGALGISPNICYVPSTILAAEGKHCGYDLEGSLLGDKAHSVVFDNTKIKRLCPGFTAVKRFDQGVGEIIHQLGENINHLPDDPEFDRFCDRMAALFPH